MKVIKKKTEQIIDEICKNKDVKKYILKKMGHFIVFCGITIGAAFRFFENTGNWADILVGFIMIVYSLYVLLLTIVEMQKISKTNT